MSDILISTEDSITTITINRVAKKNSLVPEMYAAMRDALRAAAADPAVRVVVFQGHEAVFSAGNDLQDFNDSPPQGDEAPVRQFLTEITTFPKPIIAAVCGPAVGVGTTMLFHCDLVFAGDNAKLMMPFTSLGLCPEAASSLLLPQLVGHPKAAEILYFAEPILADDALRYGLVNKVLPAAEVNAYAREQALRLAARPLTAILETKRLLRLGQRAAVQAQMEEENSSFAKLLDGPAAKEAFAAFFENRAPDFSKISG